MRVLNNENLMNLQRLTAVGLGNFDGIHKAHRALIERLIKEAKKNNLESLLYTFGEHTDNIISREKTIEVITPMEEKLNILKETQLDSVFLEKFDKSFSEKTSEEFIENILIKKLNMKLVVVGYNYTFGHKGLGNVELLKELSRKYSFEVVVLPKIKVCHEIVSSTLIRNLIRTGDIKRANELLEREFSMTGTVVSGQQVGRKLGFPTANILFDKNLLSPGDGIYDGKVVVREKVYDCIISIGKKPTFEILDNSITEVHIFDFNNDIYGEKIKIFFLDKIREQMKFSGPDELIIQIKKDISIVKNRRS